MKISFCQITKLPKVSFKSSQDLYNNFDWIDTDFFSFQQPEKDEFAGSELFDTSYGKNNAKTAESELISSKKIISDLFSERKDLINVRKEAELTAKASYIYALRLYSKDDPERNGLIKKYVLTRVREKYPAPAVKPDDKNLQQVETEKRENPPKCQKLFQNHANTLTAKNDYEINTDKSTKIKQPVRFPWKQPEERADFLSRCEYLLKKHREILNPSQAETFSRFCENGGDSYKTAKELNKKTGHLNFSITAIVKKLEKREEHSSHAKSLDARTVRFIHDVLKGHITEYNRDSMLLRYQKATEQLTKLQRNIIYLKYLDQIPYTYKEAAEIIGYKSPSEGTPLCDAARSAIAKLRKLMGIKPELSGEEKIAFMKKYPGYFTKEDVRVMEIKYSSTSAPLFAPKIQEIYGEDSTGRIRQRLDRVEKRIIRLYMHQDALNKELETENAVKEFYEIRKHLLNPLQREIIEKKYFSSSLSFGEIARQIGVLESVVSREHAAAAEILKGAKEIDVKVSKKNDKQKTINLFNEKRFFFSKRQQDLFEIVYVNPQNKTREEIMRDTALSLRQLKSFKKNVYDVLHNLSAEDYKKAREKLKNDVQKAVDEGGIKHTKLLQILTERFMNESNQNLEELGEKYGLDVAVKRASLSLMKNGIKTDIPNFIL